MSHVIEPRCSKKYLTHILRALIRIEHTLSLGPFLHLHNIRDIRGSNLRHSINQKAWSSRDIEYIFFKLSALPLLNMRAFSAFSFFQLIYLYNVINCLALPPLNSARISSNFNLNDTLLKFVRLQLTSLASTYKILTNQSSVTNHITTAYLVRL